MTRLPRNNAAAAGTGRDAWSDLADELDRWGEAGRVARLWWRDDDAVSATPHLARLLGLATGVPLALAVIPAEVQPSLARALDAAGDVAVLQHGWGHADHNPGGKKSEYPPGRSPRAVADELGMGRVRLLALFGQRAAPVFVPPWNRFSREYLPLLAGAGFAGLSAMALREPGPSMPPGIAELDVHVDLVAWKGDRGFIGTDAALGGILGQLRARRLGDTDIDRPIGILSHHRVIDAPTIDFLGELTARTQDHRAARWVAITDLLWPQ